MEKRITLRDVAKAAGVHFTTVGLALRNNPRISPATAARVRTVADQLGYHQDAMLSALSIYRHRQTARLAGVLACITTYSAEEAKHNIYDQQTMKAAGAQARKLGFGLEPFQINAPGMTAERLSRILKVRGIQGLILSPRLPLPGPIPDLDWESFSTVALGYSITNLRVHRTCAHYAHNIRMAMHVLRERGYRRIGLIVQYEVFERSMGIVPGTYLAQQYLLPATDRVVPLITRRLTKASLGQWVRRQRVDCIMLSNQPLQVLAWLAELGHKVPRDLGVCCTALSGDKDGVAGIDNQIGLLGEAAVDFVVSMLQQNERGLPVHPRSINIDGIWIEGPTVRATPVTAAEVR